MRVLILINSLSHGGAETMSYRIAKYLIKEGHFAVIATTGKYDKDIQNRIANDLTANGVKVKIADRSHGKIHFILDLIKYCKQEQIEIIHTNCKSPNYYGRIASVFLPKVKVVTTIHNMTPNSITSKDEFVLKHFTDQYVAISGRVKDFAVDYIRIPQKRLKIIYNGINTEFEYDRDVRTDNCFTIISVGRVLPAKNYLLMAKHIKKLMLNYSDVKWVILGGYSYDTQYVEKIKNELGTCIDRVNFVGETDEIGRYYSNADCFVSLSDNEGFGLAIAEATYASLPVVTTDVGVVSDLVKLGCNIHIVNEDTVDSTLQNIYQLRSSDHKVQNGYQQNSSIIRNNFSNEKMCGEYLSTYSNL